MAYSDQNPLHARRKAKADLSYGETIERAREKGRIDSAVIAKGGTAGMAPADARTVMNGTNASGPSRDWSAGFGPGANGNRPATWTDTFATASAPAALPAWAGVPPVASNDFATRQAGAFAASPAPVSSAASTTPQGRATRAIGAHRGAMIAAGTPAAATGPVGRTLSTEQGNALFGEAVPTSAAAGKNVAVQTPYGQVSSRTPDGNENWQSRVIAEHPNIGKAGTPENAEFVKAYQEAGAGADPFAIAKTVQARLTQSAPTPDIAAPSLMAPAAPVNFAGADVGPADWSQITKPSAGTRAGEKFAGLARANVARQVNPLVSLAGSATRGVVGALNTVDDFADVMAGTQSTPIAVPEWARAGAAPAIAPVRPSNTPGFSPAATMAMPTVTPTPETPVTDAYGKLFTKNPEEERRKNAFRPRPFTL
jgi:hypothetical protein